MRPNESRPAGAASELIEASKSIVTQPADNGADLIQLAARKRCTQIQVLLKSMTEKTNQVFHLLDVAKMRDDHVALGYASWTVHADDRFKSHRKSLNDLHWRLFMELADKVNDMENALWDVAKGDVR